jgi:RING-type zinc-finger
VKKPEATLPDGSDYTLYVESKSLGLSPLRFSLTLFGIDSADRKRMHSLLHSLAAEREAGTQNPLSGNRKRPAPSTSASTTPARANEPATSSHPLISSSSSLSTASSKPTNPTGSAEIQPSPGAGGTASSGSNSEFTAGECPICLEEMAEPKMLHCGHSLCADCATKTGKQAGLLAPTIYTCAVCMQDTKILAPRHVLPTNFALKSIGIK